jgi:hypothetical protein
MVVCWERQRHALCRKVELYQPQRDRKLHAPRRLTLRLQQPQLQRR